MSKKRKKQKEGIMFRALKFMLLLGAWIYLFPILFTHRMLKKEWDFPGIRNAVIAFGWIVYLIAVFCALAGS